MTRHPTDHPDLYFLIEGGKALDVCQAFIAERHRVVGENIALARELGVKHFCVDPLTGTVTHVRFPATPHHDFCRPDKFGRRAPRNGSHWDKRFRAQRGHDSDTQLIQKKLGVPCGFSYHGAKGSGSTCIGRPLSECGFLYPSEKGPYAMWIPDVAAHVARYVAQGWTVDEPARSFKPEFDGCRPILQDEWDRMVEDHNFAAPMAA